MHCNTIQKLHNSRGSLRVHNATIRQVRQKCTPELGLLGQESSRGLGEWMTKYVWWSLVVFIHARLGR
jgi:hypothetical protein